MPRLAGGALRRCLAGAAMAVLAAAAGLAGPAPAGAANGEPFAPAQWGVQQIGADVAWDVTRGGGARVGIIDTGVDLGHAELAAKVVASTRCIGTGGAAARCGGSAQDDSGHGTHVAGIVGAPLDGVGVAGVAPDAALLVVKALEADGSGEAADVAAGIDWLLARGVNVINLSLAETLSARRVLGSPLEAAIRRAADAGAVVVLAAGNHAEASTDAAFNLPAIVVGATDRRGRPARYSVPLDRGIRWGMIAPGGDGADGPEGEIVSTYWFPTRRNGYAWSEGTSMAAPHVAGAAALLAARGVRGQAAVDRLLASAAPVPCGPGCRGRLDARAAVGAVARPQAAAANRATPASPPAEPPPATPVPPASSTTSPATTAPPVADAAPARPELAITEGPAAPEAPDPGASRDLAPWLAVVAGLTLLCVAGATALLGSRRVRAA